MNKNIVIVPARGGSKRIFKKNIKFFLGKPIIEWVFDILKSSKLFSKIIVSTDNKDIANIAMKNNVSVPFVRPDYLFNYYFRLRRLTKKNC